MLFQLEVTTALNSWCWTNAVEQFEEAAQDSCYAVQSWLGIPFFTEDGIFKSISLVHPRRIFTFCDATHPLCVHEWHSIPSHLIFLFLWAECSSYTFFAHFSPSWSSLSCRVSRSLTKNTRVWTCIRMRTHSHRIANNTDSRVKELHLFTHRIQVLLRIILD